MEKEKKSKGMTVLVVLLLLVTIASLVLATYAWAKYTSSVDGNATAQVAKWDVNVSFDKSQFVKTYNYVAEDRIAPGTSGQLDLSLTYANTEVDFDYVITIANLKNKPTNLKFYSNADCTQELVFDASSAAGTSGAKIAEGTVRMIGDDGKAKSTPTVQNTTGPAISSGNFTIYWKWPYTTGNSAEEIAANDITDTNDGINAQNEALGTMSFDVTVTATQVAPTVKN